MPQGGIGEGEEAGEVAALGLLRSAGPHMVQHTGGIQSGTTQHSTMLTITRISLQRPLDPQRQVWKLEHEWVAASGLADWIVEQGKDI